MKAGKRTLAASAIALTAAALAPLTAAAPASASTKPDIVYNIVTTGDMFCYAAMDAWDKGGIHYVRGRFYARIVENNYCSAGLYRFDQRLSYLYHQGTAESPGRWDTTGWHRDIQRRDQVITWSHSFEYGRSKNYSDYA